MPSILLVTNDFGPRAGGIETFVIGLLERMPSGEVVVYTSSQEGSADFDQRWKSEFGVEVIRDRSSILLPTPRVIKNLRNILRARSITKVWFGAAAHLAYPLAGYAKRVQLISSLSRTAMKCGGQKSGHSLGR